MLNNIATLFPGLVVDGFFRQDGGEAGQRIERRANFMAHVGKEKALCPDGIFFLLFHFFQFLLRLAQFFISSSDQKDEKYNQYDYE